MPIYEYICGRCGNRLEVFQKLNDPPLWKCRVCGGSLKKIISPPALQFKGNGWYITDYARKAPAKKETERHPEAANRESSSAKKLSEAPQSSTSED